MPALPAPPSRHRLPRAVRRALRRGEAFARPRLGTLRHAGAGVASALKTGHKGHDSGALVVTRSWTTDARRAGHAPSPRDGPTDLGTVCGPSDGDALHHPTHDRWPVLRSCGCGGPQGWHVVRPAEDRLPRTGGHLRGTRASEARLRLLQRVRVPARLCPAPLHRTGNKAVFRRDGCVVTRGPRGLGARALQRVAPVPPPHCTRATPAGAPACAVGRPRPPGTLRRGDDPQALRHQAWPAGTESGGDGSGPRMRPSIAAHSAHTRAHPPVKRARHGERRTRQRWRGCRPSAGGSRDTAPSLLEAGTRSALSTSQASGGVMVRPVLRRPGCGWRGSRWRCPQR
jgi:hypothetical protein